MKTISSRPFSLSSWTGWHRRQQFDPGALGWLVNPFYFARRGLRDALARVLPELRGEVLDVGCGTKPYRELVSATRYVGLDRDSPLRRETGAADVFYDGRKFPLPDEAFDGALCTQVLEHVFTPEEFLGEIRRVLRPGGVVVLTVPFIWDEHEQPHDFGRYSSFGLRALLERSGFEVVRLEKTPTDARALAQLAAGWVYKLVAARNRWANLAAQIVFIAPITVLGALAAAVLPRNPDFYLDNVVLAKKRTAQAAR
jgi:SAM-dependent methyltransferase